MFADDTNLFFSHSDINILFEKMNKELTNVSNWFNANKLSLNVKKTKFSFFHKPSKKDNIPLRLPNLNINGFTIERESSIKFLGVWIDENLTWRDHIHTVESKVAKNIGLLYPEKHYLDDKCLKQIYFTYIHAYLNYANIAWSSTNKTKLKKVQSKQKHALRITFNQSKNSPSGPLFLSLNVLNVYQNNIIQCVQFMHEKQKYFTYLPKTIRCTMPWLSHQFLLNKFFSNTSIRKNYTVYNIS